MLKISVACVGKIKEKYLTEGLREYEKRLSAYCRFAWLEVPDEKTQEGASETEDAIIRKTEGERLLKRIPADAYVIALTIDGKVRDSVGFSAHLDKLAVSGESHIVFVIGGSIGLSEEVQNRADETLSFSAMTFPHQLMRLILAEQLYRAFRISRHEPYHK